MQRTRLVIIGGGPAGNTCATVAATLGTVLKYREDQERTRQHGLAELIKQATERGFQSH